MNMTLEWSMKRYEPIYNLKAQKTFSSSSAAGRVVASGNGSCGSVELVSGAYSGGEGSL